MATNIVHINLDGIDVRQDREGRFCLNDLHKAAGGAKKDQPSDWLGLETTQRLIAAIDEEVKIPGNPGIKSKQGVGTFACVELVYDYAAWISPEFKLKVYRTFHAAQARPKTETPKPAALPGSVEDTLRGCVLLKDELVADLGVDKGIAWSHILSVADNKLGTTFHTEMRALLPSARDFREPTQIDAALGLDRVGRLSATNAILQEHGYQVKDASGVWVPTEQAIEGRHWMRKPFSKNNGHSGLSLLWDMNLIETLVEELV